MRCPFSVLVKFGYCFKRTDNSGDSSREFDGVDDGAGVASEATVSAMVVTTTFPLSSKEIYIN